MYRIINQEDQFPRSQSCETFQEITIQDDVIAKGSYGCLREALVSGEQGRWIAKMVVFENKENDPQRPPNYRDAELLFRVEATVSKIASDRKFGPRVVSVFICQTESQEPVGVMIMERWDGDLNALPLGQLTHLESLWQAITTMHDQGIFHQDLFPRNILFRRVNGETQYAITDFGLSLYFEQPLSSTLREIEVASLVYGYYVPDRDDPDQPWIWGALPALQYYALRDFKNSGLRRGIKARTNASPMVSLENPAANLEQPNYWYYGQAIIEEAAQVPATLSVLKQLFNYYFVYLAYSTEVNETRARLFRYLKQKIAKTRGRSDEILSPTLVGEGLNRVEQKKRLRENEAVKNGSIYPDLEVHRTLPWQQPEEEKLSLSLPSPQLRPQRSLSTDSVLSREEEQFSDSFLL